ncbi:MAG: hypothetical protein A2W17_11055 [Planctomycetes bacterium RBG_16_41_13]|nr:MAG: hypothetical protein A2W17_11055 [Planctomycetes bacterium RBG_16_41_13]
MGEALKLQVFGKGENRPVREHRSDRQQTFSRYTGSLNWDYSHLNKNSLSQQSRNQKEFNHEEHEGHEENLTKKRSFYRVIL